MALGEFMFKHGSQKVAMLKAHHCPRQCNSYVTCRGLPILLKSDIMHLQNSPSELSAGLSHILQNSRTAISSGMVDLFVTTGNLLFVSKQLQIFHLSIVSLSAAM